MPFGEELGAGIGGRTTGLGFPGTADGVRQKFTQKERDIETGLDYFGARYYSSTLGRFTSVDPLMASGRASRPQSWNRYSYVLNNPLRLIDPIGLIDQEVDDEVCEARQCSDAGENAEPQNSTLVRSATIRVGNTTIQGEVGAFGVTFNLDSAQTAELFGAQSFRVDVSLRLPAEVASMTPTTLTDVLSTSDAGINRALETGASQRKDSATLTSGSRLVLPENSNFSLITTKPVLTQPDGPAVIAPGNRGAGPSRVSESGVSFNDLTQASGFKTTTASITLRPKSDSLSGGNSFTMRLEGRTQNSRIYRESVQIAIRPSK